MKDMGKTFNVYLVDDHPCMLDGLERLMADQSSYSVIGKAILGRSAIEAVPRLGVDILILDLDLPDLTGFEVAKALKNQVNHIVLYSYCLSQDRIRQAQLLGIKGGIEKTFSSDKLIECLDGIRANKTIFFTKSTLNYSSARPSSIKHSPVKQLSKQENKIVKLVAEGMTTQQIALALFVSLKTVEWYRGNICRKLGLSGKGALLRYALSHRHLLLAQG